MYDTDKNGSTITISRKTIMKCVIIDINGQCYNAGIEKLTLIIKTLESMKSQIENG